MQPGFHEVLDATDPRLQDYAGLTDVKLRSRFEPAEGLFIAEGAKVIRRAAAAGYVIRSFLMASRWQAGLVDVVRDSGATAYVADEALLESITGYAVHRGALASCARRPLPEVEDLLARARHVVVLEDLTDHTNVGLVFRSAAALGIDAVLLAPRCADPLYRRAVKTSMGAVLTLPYTRIQDWSGGLARLRATGFEVLALTPDPAARLLDDILPGAADRVALVLGCEGGGLSERWLQEADHRVRIRQRSDVDSLNVAAAAAIACALLAARQPASGEAGVPGGAGQCGG
ncbi:MAG: RNA methyltransferase [Actinomycetes bacterium]